MGVWLDFGGCSWDFVGENLEGFDEDFMGLANKNVDGTIFATDVENQFYILHGFLMVFGQPHCQETAKRTPNCSCGSINPFSCD